MKEESIYRDEFGYSVNFSAYLKQRGEIFNYSLDTDFELDVEKFSKLEDRFTKKMLNKEISKSHFKRIGKLI
jgi:hypothetical protein